jgi:hypothetical protein
MNCACCIIPHLLPHILPYLLQGDLLVEVLGAAVKHDLSYMASSFQYRRNRDRVITMGMSLHTHAMALHRCSGGGGVCVGGGARQYCRSVPKVCNNSGLWA